MDQENERPVDVLTDLGAVEVETRGGIVGFLDAQGTKQPSMGLSDD